MLLKDKKSTWQMSCKESTKREHEVFVLADERKAQGKVHENTTAIIIRGLKRIRKISQEEEKAVKELSEDTGREATTRRRNVERIRRIYCRVGDREETDVLLKLE